MASKNTIAPVRILSEDVANKIAAGEVVERPASVVKELVENSLDAGATRIIVRLVAAGRRTIEVVDDGHGMSEQNSLLAIERHATSKLRKAEDLEQIATLGFRGEALPSIAAVSRFEMVTRCKGEDSATRLRIDGGILRDVSEAAAPVGTRVTVNRLYFNTPARAKFLKGTATELGRALDVVQRLAIAREGVGFQFFHNDRELLHVPPQAGLKERVSLVWGWNFVQDMAPLASEVAGFKMTGLIGNPGLTRSSRSHQFFMLNGRSVVNRSLQYGFEEGYRGLLTVGRFPVGVVLLSTNPRLVDVNIHPSKREVRFRDERAARDAVRDGVRSCLGSAATQRPTASPPLQRTAEPMPLTEQALPEAWVHNTTQKEQSAPTQSVGGFVSRVHLEEAPDYLHAERTPAPAVQTNFLGEEEEAEGDAEATERIVPLAMYQPLESLFVTPMQIFDSYLLVPDGERLLIIDQHALHERLNYDNLVGDLNQREFAAQQLAVPLLLDVPASHAKLLEKHRELFWKIGIEIEPFGGNTFQVTAICHLYDESRVPDLIYHVLDEVAQGDLFSRDDFMADCLRLATEACRASIKAGDRLSPEERRGLLEGFRRLRPPYTCPHGRPIITELTLHQMEKSFRRIQ